METERKPTQLKVIQLTANMERVDNEIQAQCREDKALNKKNSTGKHEIRKMSL